MQFESILLGKDKYIQGIIAVQKYVHDWLKFITYRNSELIIS